MATQSETETVAAPIELGPFDAACLPGGLSLSQEMGWPYRLEDWAFAAQLGQGLVLVRAGEVIGTAIALNLLFKIPLVWGVILTALDVLVVLWLANRGFRWLESIVISLIGFFWGDDKKLLQRVMTSERLIRV